MHGSASVSHSVRPSAPFFLNKRKKHNVFDGNIYITWSQLSFHPSVCLSMAHFTILFLGFFQKCRMIEFFSKNVDIDDISRVPKNVRASPLIQKISLYFYTAQ